MTASNYNAALWIKGHADRSGGRCALVDGERRFTYRELFERIARCASVFAARDIGRGDRVALVLGNGSPYLEAVFAAAQLGAIAVPINARLTVHEILHVLDDCTPRLMLYDPEHADVALRACDAALQPPSSRLRCGGEEDAYEHALAHAAPREEIAEMGPDDPAILMYTSGTTGLPKGALLPCRKSVYNNKNAEIFFELTDADNILIVLPLFHSFGLAILALPALYAGATVVLHRQFDPDTLWRTVDVERITFFGGVPTMFERLRDAVGPARKSGCSLESLRFLFTAGSAISVELIRDFEREGILLKQGYGQTETSVLCCLESRDALRKAGSVGRPVQHAEVRVVREAGLSRDPAEWEDVDVGETGEVVVRGPITMLGYWRRPDESAETLRGDWLRTHDLGTLDAEGFITLVGRNCDMYISGGENVYPAEIEAVYSAHPTVREIAVVGIPDAHWGESGRAFIVPASDEPVDVHALLAWGRERLAKFKLPSEFVVVETLPRTITGKLQKHRLPGFAVTDSAPAGRGRNVDEADRGRNVEKESR